MAGVRFAVAAFAAWGASSKLPAMATVAKAVRCRRMFTLQWISVAVIIMGEPTWRSLAGDLQKWQKGEG
ncbi:hypothetical protein Pta02_42100 [Planobispora takensis]|uniref:Uncharacterized protein n=1 Tax=Planobispora takensis TaxID=1367882 RepID=A0A8J3SZK6_9ACTN|nr:hypothetical protein Pta02_42100 [Planobispora takensis]